MLSSQYNRIDVQGNRLPVTLPLENWTSISDGALNITPDHPVQWIPNGLPCDHRTVRDHLPIHNNQRHKRCHGRHGLIVDSADADGMTYSITADETLVVKAKAMMEGNR